MNLINFQEEFEKIARKHGMGEAISAGVTCHKAEEGLKRVFPEGDGKVVSFKNGLLTIKFGSSSALAGFHVVKSKLVEEVNGSLGKNLVTEVRAVIG